MDAETPARFESLLSWTERSMDDLPGSTRLSRELERSGVKLRLGHLPWLALVAAFFFGVVSMVVGAPPPLALLAMLVGLAAPFVALASPAGGGRRRSTSSCPTCSPRSHRRFAPGTAFASR